jgi:beta-lactamase class A
MATSRPATRTLLETVEDRTQQLLSSTPTGGGTVSLWLAGLDGTVVLDRDAGAVHYAASTMKVPLVVAAHRRHERGDLDLDAEVEVHNRFVSAGDGSAYSLAQDEDQDDWTWERLGSRVPLRALADHALVHSGNLATNLVLEQVGTGEVARVLADAGCSPATTVARGIEDLAAARLGVNNLVTAADLGRVLRGIASRTLAAEASCIEIEGVLARQEHRDGIPAGLPAGTYVANKTGWVEGITHDLALVRPAGRSPYVLVVLTTVDVPEDDGQSFIADVSRIVWEAWPA